MYDVCKCFLVRKKIWSSFWKEKIKSCFGNVYSRVLYVIYIPIFTHGYQYFCLFERFMTLCIF